MEHVRWQATPLWCVVAQERTSLDCGFPAAGKLAGDLPGDQRQAKQVVVPACIPLKPVLGCGAWCEHQSQLGCHHKHMDMGALLHWLCLGALPGAVAAYGPVIKHQAHDALGHGSLWAN